MSSAQNLEPRPSALNLVRLLPDGGVGGQYTMKHAWINSGTGRGLAIDWDLTLDHLSTDFNRPVFGLVDPESAESMTNREEQLYKCGYTEEDEKSYVEKVHAMLCTFLEWRSNGECDFVILTRNKVQNVEHMIDYVGNRVKYEFGKDRVSAEDFPIVSFPENNVEEDRRMSKLLLLMNYFPNFKCVKEIIFVDDSHGKSSSEHERFAADLSQNFERGEMTVHYVKVVRCPRHRRCKTATGLKTKERYPYGEQGLGNQPDKWMEIRQLVEREA